MLREDIVHLNDKERIIQPLIYRQIYADENPLTYLSHIASQNKCERVSWLIDADQHVRFHLSYSQVVAMLRLSLWNENSIDSETEKLFSLPSVFLDKSYIKFCPSCLREEPYYRMCWQLKTSLICLKHHEYLQELCPACLQFISFDVRENGICDCGFNLLKSPSINANKSSMNLQYFIDNMENENLFMFPRGHISSLTLEQRIQFILKLDRWELSHLRAQGILKKNKNTSINSLKIIAETFFSTEEKFSHFLLELKNRPYIAQKISYFVVFYRSFFTDFSASAFKIYRKWIEEFILKHLDISITHRNTLFSRSTIAKYPWITMKAASKKTGIPISGLRRAIIDKRLVMTELEKEKRIYKLIYLPSVLSLKQSLKDLMNFDEAKKYLGITKKQLYELLNNGIFKNVVKPQQGYNSEWSISKKYLDKLIKDLSKMSLESGVEGITLADAMKVICGRITDAFYSLLVAILDCEVGITFIETGGDCSLKNVRVCPISLDSWIARLTKKQNYITIMELSTYLGINQESAYQLVNKGLIEHERVDRNRFISKKNLIAFEGKYILLSHYAKKYQTSSKYLINFLADKGVFPIDSDWDIKLRQRVYLKTTDVLTHLHDGGLVS